MQPLLQKMIWCHNIHYLLVVGINVNELIYELRQGIRLSDHPSCPDPICHMIHTCFLENPSHRPDFSELKEAIQSACDDLVGNVKSNKVENESAAVDPYTTMMPLKDMKHNDMKEQYIQIQMANEINPRVLDEERKKSSVTYVNAEITQPCSVEGEVTERSNILIQPQNEETLKSTNVVSGDQKVTVDSSGYATMSPKPSMTSPRTSTY
jgi:hypothetical protein